MRSLRTTLRIALIALCLAASGVASSATLEGILRRAHSGEAPQAAEQAREHLVEQRAVHGEDSLEFARAVELLYDVSPAGAHARTDSLSVRLGQAQRVREARFGVDDAKVLPALWRLCAMVRREGDGELAGEILERCQRIVESESELPWEYEVEVQLAAGDFAYNVRDLAAARDAHGNALELAELHEHPPGRRIVIAARRLASAQRRMGLVEDAVQSCERALEIGEAALHPMDVELAAAFNLRATLMREGGNYAQAIADNERAAEIFATNLGDEHAFVAGVLNNLGNLLRDLGDDRGAVRALEASASARLAIYGAEHPIMGQSWLNLANAQASLDEWEAAIQSYERALVLLRRRPVRGAEPLAKALCSLAAAKNEEARHADALELLREAETVIQAGLSPDHPLLVLAWFNQAIAERGLGNLDASLEQIQRGLALEARLYGSQSPRLAHGLGLEAATRFARGEVEEAIRLSLEAERSSRDLLSWNASELGDTRIGLFAGARVSTIPNALFYAQDSVREELLEAVFEEAFRSRGVVMDHAMRRRRHLHERGDPRTGAAVRALDEARGQLLAHVLSEAASDDAAQRAREFDSLRGEVEAAEARLARLDYASAEAGRSLDLRSMRDALPPDTVLLSYWYAAPSESRGDPHGSYFAMITAHDSLRLVRIDRADLVDAELALWRETIEHPPMHDARRAERVALDRAERLRRRIWDPLADALAGAEWVFVVPDGELHFLPFAALPHPTGEYFAESGPTIHYLSSERDLLPPRAASSIGKRHLLALGGADFDSEPDRIAEGEELLPLGMRGVRDCGSLRSHAFEPLPASLNEANEISGIWNAHGTRSSKLLVGREASEAELRGAIDGASMLHFATHGFYLGGDCASTEPTLRGVGGLAYSWSSEGSVEESFRLSGLALAGANRRGAAAESQNDGILTAEEVASLDLRGVRWAVLSACDTGLGDLMRAEGVQGLRRSFRIAGAAAVISSLWAVEDEATREWMAVLYRARVEDSSGAAIAVRAAQRAVLQQRRARGDSTHPFFWASFTGCGRWEN